MDEFYTDEFYMRRALELAEKGRGYTNPNPMVGAVIVKDNRIIGEGYHHRYGDLHAERDAIKNCTESTENATIYVTLEPCAMCAGALTQSRINKVYIGAKDEKNGCVGSIANILDINTTHKVKYEYLEDARECSLILTNFFKELRKKKK